MLAKRGEDYKTFFENTRKGFLLELQSNLSKPHTEDSFLISQPLRKHLFIDNFIRIAVKFNKVNVPFNELCLQLQVFLRHPKKYIWQMALLTLRTNMSLILNSRWCALKTFCRHIPVKSLCLQAQNNFDEVCSK